MLICLAVPSSAASQRSVSACRLLRSELCYDSLAPAGTWTPLKTPTPTPCSLSPSPCHCTRAQRLQAADLCLRVLGLRQSRSPENLGLTCLHRVKVVPECSGAHGKRVPTMPNRLMSFQTANPSQKLMGSLGTGQRSEQTLLNEDKFKLFNMSVGGRTPFLIASSTWCLWPLAATRWCDPFWDKSSPRSTYPTYSQVEA